MKKIIPSKIISLVPSQTELLYDLGLFDEVIGITKFCIYPNEWFRTKTRIGGTKNVNVDFIKLLNPDLILANQEENTKEEIEELKKYFQVYVSQITTFNEALLMIKEVGVFLNKQEKSLEIIDQILNEKEKYQSSKKIANCLYFIWNKPYMLAGKNTFIDSMMDIAGFENCITETRYPIISEKELIALQPKFIFLSSEPFPFKHKHKAELKKLLPNTQIIFVDGELFSWYGSRMLQSFQYFSKLYEELSQ